MIPDVTPNGVFYLPPTGWLTSFYNPPNFFRRPNLISKRKRSNQLMNSYNHSFISDTKSTIHLRVSTMPVLLSL
ncbi:hypothetical protein LV515_07165 [Limosilactobacillus vaginalis]|nr:hypothetical protein LV515_07165 [Limosilactobacillus vaginalis]